MKSNGNDVEWMREELGRLRGELARVTRQRDILKARVRKNPGSVIGRYEEIKAQEGEYSVRELCEAMEVSRSGYYGWRGRVPSAREVMNLSLLEVIQKIFCEHRGRYGSRRIMVVLERMGQGCNHKRVERLMRENGLRGRSRARSQPRTTNSTHSELIAPNLLVGRGKPTAVDQIWVTDITYLRTEEGWVYLAAVMDLFSRRIIGWSLQESLELGLPLEALDRALARRGGAVGVIHHSDRGCQYASRRYCEALEERGFCRSMSREGHGFDNMAIESFWSTLKTEMRVEREGLRRIEVSGRVKDYIEVYYNRVRLHSALGYSSPREFEVKPRSRKKRSTLRNFL